MYIQQVYGSEKAIHHRALRESKQILPFYSSHQKSRGEFWQSVKKNEAWQIVNKKRTMYIVAERTKEQLVIKNLLVKGKLPSWTSFFKDIEWCARFFFKKICFLQFSDSLHMQWISLLSRYGYMQDNTLRIKHGWQKKVAYHMALVLGGGGAHGAYQIGVWKALKEKSICFDILTGTSVGALNGALILQDDLPQAISLWQTLSTNQVLQLSEVDLSEDLRKRFIQETRLMTRSAITEGGASIAPLEKLLKRKLDPHKVLKVKHPRLFTISTRLPDFTEIVTPIQQLPADEIADWILASASFYPAMAYRQIKGTKYIDGGYRNNLPVDVAIQEGATECFVVDVYGPGINKRMTLPEEVVQWSCQSAWSLGSFLIFDCQRNQFNIQLGYLEAKKSLGDYEGHWYTFYSTKDATIYWRKFLKYLLNELRLDLSFIYDLKFLQSLRNIYKDRVVIETCGVAMLELLAKRKLVLPNKVYHVHEMIEKICKSKMWIETNESIREIGQLNNDEWRRLQKYRKKQKNDQKKFIEIVSLIKQSKQEKLQAQIRTQPFESLLNLYLYYLKEEQIWHKNFHMKS